MYQVSVSARYWPFPTGIRSAGENWYRCITNSLCSSEIWDKYTSVVLEMR